MALVKEFKAFALKGNVIDLAVAVVIGTAFTKIVNALVEQIMMPLIGKIMPDVAWATYEVKGIKVGVVLGAILEFLIVAFVLFLVVVKAMGALRKRGNETKPCSECLEIIPAGARRCRACASPQTA